MDWAQLLSEARFKAPRQAEGQRSPFQRDADRIIFSAAFRRLQDKTQVHPFPDSDYVRRRLTHSLEVSSVGRSLGTHLGYFLLRSDRTLSPTLPFDLGQIVANACLAHDIGNPPFGHAGEKAIGSWFKDELPSGLKKDLSEQQRNDLEKFEGNAQGFRLLTRLQDFRDEGGIRLTYATLATFTKYPTTSIETETNGYIGAKKHGFFSDDVPYFADIADTVGLPMYARGWRRHPLVFLMEAADDICYRVIDVEDAFKLGRLSFREAEELLGAIVPSYARSDQWGEDDTISWLRAKAIGALIEQVRESVESNLPALMSGDFSEPLIDCISAASAVETAYAAVKKHVFGWDRIVSAEIAGAQMITDVLQKLVFAIEAPGSYRNAMLLKIVPHYDDAAPTYTKILAVTDFLAGMTDTYLRRIHGRVTGHAIL
ncbi:dGTP triphosphohydrolase [Methylocystis iwaonis]|uniref:Deoxyguanosinetriphosphate triphosphohydrolase n=1 Tax=Methylocystis iwaonis TaxID=2885079 RepID=A0ABM8E7U4_9HYPH|nr:dNTP triphosphohydrolase [Methylocystis iwaonis]BDV33948.1 deoxyguanosinetriphosphate triphosphohydrolase [Methylocystis iwaonis]